MHLHRYTILLIVLFFTLTRGTAQDFPPEDICVPFGSGLIANVIEGDLPPGDDFTYFTSPYEDECFFLDERGNLFFRDSATEERCCGPQQPFFVEVFRSFSNGEQELIGVQEINITIKCLKPDCGLVNLEDYTAPPPDPTNEMPVPAPCIPACENSTVTYLFDQDAGLAYDWSASNGSALFDPGLPGQLTVTWGPLGAASLSVDIHDPSGNLLETRVWCVDLTPAPVADFSASAVACLNQDIYFTNTSAGAPATYDWDFGDGNTAQNVTNPSHAYSTAGTYTVTMFATSTSVNPDGSDGCCCTDSISYDIVVDPLPGPGIFWVSTLCEDDASKYWTDATGCGSIAWSVSANGTITSGQGTDTIMVQWGGGPAGTITLDAGGCDIPYCPYPTTAVVPIISSAGDITGPVAVCKGETVSYELPKWMTVAYSWSVSDPSIIINGDNDGNTISVTWPSVPGTYEIYADYGSDFLNGLPGHTGDDCYGSAVLSVTVLGDFTISATPNPACDGNTVFVQGFSDIGPTSYNWTVTGHPGLSATGPTAGIVFPGPGVYGLTAEVVNPEDYCTETRSTTVVIKEAVTPVITGPTDYCVGEPVVYSILSPTPGYSYNWTPTGGTVITGDGGPTVEVIFTVSTGASLSVIGSDDAAPFCTSAPAVVNPETRNFVGPPSITGPSPCTNSQAVYGIDIPQHSDVIYSWSVMPETAGSVVGGVDTPNPTINWNNDGGPVTVQLVMELCGQTLTLAETFNLNAPTEPVIVQVGELCPSGSANLEIDGSLFSSISWSTGATTSSITVTTPGNYVVNTIDLNGCPGTDRFRVEEVDGPEAALRMSGNNAICVNNPPYPANPVLTALTDAANTIEWFCNGESQGAAATGNTTFIHVWNDTIKTYAYTVLVTDPNGCTTTPDPLFVYQRPCCDTPYVSRPLPLSHTFMATPQSPGCDIVDLTATFPADSVDCHAWDLPRYTSILGGGGDTTGTTATENLTIQLPGVGCFKLESEVYNWAYDYDTTMIIDPVTGLQSQVITKEDSIKCGEAILLTVCNPLSAEFDYSEDCGKVTFINESLIDPSLTSGTVNYAWDFGDGPGSGSSTLENPMYTYEENGVYEVTLIVSDDNCQSTFTLFVTVENLPDSDFTFSPNPACYGQPVTFSGTGTDVIEWKWDFGDGAVFVGNNPQHTFLPSGGSGSATITLTTENSGGCRDTVAQTIIVNPVPDTVGIIATPDLIICEGDSTTLSVPAVAGNTYAWTNGATGSSITVSTAGVYGLTITSTDGCATIIDPVKVQVIPLPDASWFGNPFICDNSSTTLTAAAGGGHTYEWFNATTGTTATTREYTVNYFFNPPEQDIILTVTNAFGCKSEAAITVKQVPSPAPVLTVTGGECEGDGSTITVTNPEPGVVYSWNTGETGLSIFTYQSGAYTVLATDPVSGCTGSATAVINPLPDLCIVPVGCYESCNPDTLYAPPGNYAFEWFDENGPLNDFDDSTVVSVSGVYHVVVTDLTTGCVATSEPLDLEVIDCDSTSCDDLVTRLNPINADEVNGACCYDLTYANLPDGVYFIRVSSTDAELTASNINPALGYFGTPDPFTLEFAIDVTLTSGLPVAMAAPAVARICPSAILNNPQSLLIEYLDAEGNVVCDDTLETFCEQQPECAYVASDTLSCNDDGTLSLTLTVCVPADQEFAVGHLQVLDTISNAVIDLTVSPALSAGECRTFTTSLGVLPPGSDFCYQLIAHTADPALDPAALCCSIGEVRCLTVPDCDPCDDLVVEGVVRAQGDDCCYDIYLYDGAPTFDFNQIDLCLLSGDATLSINNQLGDPLTGVVNPGGTTASVFPVGGGVLPDGDVFQLPTLCLNDGSVTNYLLEIKWIDDTGVACRDTVSLLCKPDCGYLEQEKVECVEDRYVWTGNIVNNSDYPVGEAYIQFPAGSGLSPYNTTIVFPTTLNPGDAAPVQIGIGNPAGPGDTVCFKVVLHELADSDLHLNCCDFEACIVLPDCRITKCACNDLPELVAQGIDTLRVGPSPRDYLLQTVARLNSCDEIRWRVRRLQPNRPWELIGFGYDVPFLFTENWLYLVQATVYRTDEAGNPCPPRSTTLRVDFRQGSVPFNPDADPGVEVFPNPTNKLIDVVSAGGGTANVSGRLELIDTNGRRIMYLPPTGAAGNSRRIDLTGLAPGIYLLRGEAANGSWVKRIVKQ